MLILAATGACSRPESNASAEAASSPPQTPSRTLAAPPAGQPTQTTHLEADPAVAAAPTTAPTSDAPQSAHDITSGAGIRAAFCAAVDDCTSIAPWLELAELALSSLSSAPPASSGNNEWTYRVDWPHSDDRVEVTSTTGLPNDAHVVQVRVELERAGQPDGCPVALDGLLQIFLRWRDDSLVECTVMTQFHAPDSAELDAWIERAQPGSRRKGAFVQCYSEAPSLRRTIELSLERTPQGPVRESRFVDAPRCECSARSRNTAALSTLCRAVRQSPR